MITIKLSTPEAGLALLNQLLRETTVDLRDGLTQVQANVHIGKCVEVVLHFHPDWNERWAIGLLEKALEIHKSVEVRKEL